ncbi:MAG: polynucleotide adenylyltransferase PcnB [Neisseria sp.]|nr:polynucleotide adenylyltransferase PcnB [Neisseria sp.]
MIKKLIQKVLPKRQKTPRTRCLNAAQHPLRMQHLNFAAEKVIKRLHAEGFQAYVVGGAVRDLLLGREPKDFDVATDASPEQVRKIFRRSRIIGRRFQIVHVMVGPETIEVTTFRGGDGGAQNEHGRIMRDNQFGTRSEDAARRDFTCNALYFDPVREELFDDHGGCEDIAARELVMIGDPAARFREDPMRILRAVRLSAKLGFTVSPAIQAAIGEHAHLVRSEPIARLFDEIMKELLCGYATECLQQLHVLGIPTDTHPLFQALETDEDTADRRFLHTVLSETDARVRADKPVSVGFILAALLWATVRRQWQQHLTAGMKPVPALQRAIGDVKESTERGWGVPHRFAATMREIWQLQPQFDIMRGKRPLRLLTQERFRAAYDFYVLRARCGEASNDTAQWWTRFQAASDEEREQMLNAAPQSSDHDAPKRRRRRKPRAAGSNESSA